MSACCCQRCDSRFHWQYPTENAHTQRRRPHLRRQEAYEEVEHVYAEPVRDDVPPRDGVHAQAVDAQDAHQRQPTPAAVDANTVQEVLVPPAQRTREKGHVISSLVQRLWCSGRRRSRGFPQSLTRPLRRHIAIGEGSASEGSTPRQIPSLWPHLPSATVTSAIRVEPALLPAAEDMVEDAESPEERSLVRRTSFATRCCSRDKHPRRAR